MRKAICIVLLLLVVAVGVGFYLGWFGVSGSHDSETGRTSIQFVIDQSKIKANFEQVKEKLSSATSSAKEQGQDQ